ncbi:MAG: cell division protein ZapA [Clostridiales bacterium]|jgi:cell division protein ZapA|nr:cell division protein ZapA [Clostridiales bacterium]
MEVTRATVEVAGQTIRLRGKEDEAYIKEVAAYVDEKVNALQQAHPALSTSNCVVLTAINIADELFKLRRQYAELDRRIDELRQINHESKTPVRKSGGAKAPVKHPFEERGHAFRQEEL